MTTLRSFLLLLYLIVPLQANLRCYSCSSCNELEYFAGDPKHFEADCYFDRFCMKISGRSRDIFGYTQEINFRGCPWVSLLGTLSEGCTESKLSIVGGAFIEGTFCLCKDHLCNFAIRSLPTITSLLSIIIFNVFFVVQYVL